MDVFVDTNVVFSACLGQRGRSRGLFKLAETGLCRLLTSSYVLDEAKRNLAKKAPHGLNPLAELGKLLGSASDPPDELVRLAAGKGLPAKDAPILAAAVHARADLLVTGDRRHFGPMFGRTFEGVRVVSLADGLAAVLATAGRDA